VKLKSLRIQNYKCIEDSNEFSLEPITCLVGKNESGKSALLKALYKLNPDIRNDEDFNPLQEYPRRKYSEYKSRQKEDPDNVLTTLWELEESDLEILEKKVGLDAFLNPTIKITKGYNNETYYDFDISESNIVDYYYKKYGDEIKAWVDTFGGAKTIPELIEKVETSIAVEDDSNELRTKLDNLRKELQEAFPDSDPMNTCIEIISKRLPIFLYFGSYYKLPGQVSIDNLLKKQIENKLDPIDRVFLALLDLAGTNLDQISQIGQFEELVAEMEAVSNRISQEIFEYWSQNSHLEVVCQIDNARRLDPPPYNTGYVFRIRIKNNRHKVTLSFDERSSGFVWFFSFLVWFSQLKRSYEKNLIILLDEPGLTLHGKAQADLLRYFNDKLKPYYQVIYTTHSPFMIDPDNFLGIRTVEDVASDGDFQGTKVGDKVFSTDAETIFPLQAALGYEITQSLFIGKHNLLVEGPSDLVYLKWASNELKGLERTYLDPRWIIVPCGGIDKLGSFNALFGGNKLDVAILTDFSDGQKKKVRNLKESSLLKRGHVFSAEVYADQDEADIEDVLGRSFYVALVNKCYSLKGSDLIPDDKHITAPVRVLKEVENHFAGLPPDKFSEFDHYRPSSFLIENSAKLRNLAGINSALDNFERLFKDINNLLNEC
jgi:predicted ATP-dependent endonuclease of OLD family